MQQTNSSQNQPKIVKGTKKQTEMMPLPCLPRYGM